MVLLIMGVAGSGKTTVGRALSDATAIPFLDADDYHPPENVAKMRRGEPLGDQDRRAWLELLRERIDEAIARGESTIVACSALKSEYRTTLGTERAAIGLVYLQIGEELARSRLALRSGHFMKETMAASQFAALEPPERALVLDAAKAPSQLVFEIRRAFSL